MPNFKQLTTNIGNLHDTLRRAAVGSVNRILTFRYWLIGRYIVEYEQSGSDRAAYGANILSRLAQQLRDRRGFSERNLQLFRVFYRMYPQISHVIPSQLSLIGHELEIPQLATAELQPVENKEITSHSPPAELLVRHFSFTHFVELMRLTDPLKRSFYEIEGIRGGWSVP